MRGEAAIGFLQTNRQEWENGPARSILRGPVVMQAYLDNPAETAQALRERDGRIWLYTGDLGSMDAYGRVFLRDRKKQLIRVKGYSVFSTEAEDLVGRHEAVYECAAAGFPDTETGKAVKVWVVLRRGMETGLSGEDLRAWCKEHIAHYKVPKYIEFIDALPKTPVGKVLRRKLQEADRLYGAGQ